MNSSVPSDQSRTSRIMSRLTARTAGRVVLIVAALGTIACDRVTKHVAATTFWGLPHQSYLADMVRLGYVENPGGFLSLGANLPPAARTALFTAATGLTLGILALLAVRRRWDTWSALGLTLFFAGAYSNWIDRVIRGSVVDFLNLGVGPLRTGVFNVADVAIMIGAGLVILGEIRDIRDLPSVADAGNPSAGPPTAS
jgi:signal peptidase II